jgi:hypothetical protein
LLPGRRPSRLVARQVVKGVHAGGDVTIDLVQVEQGVFITVLDVNDVMYDVRPLQASPAPDPEQARERPVILLGANAAVTPLVGRKAEMTALARWYDDGGSFSVMMVHGAGGIGKTRLTREFAAQVSRRDERPEVVEAFSLTEIYINQRAVDDHGDSEAGDSPGILLLIDEADIWSQRKLLTAFRTAMTWQCGKLRILVTARSAGWWWSGLRAELDLIQVTWNAMPLDPLEPAELKELGTAAGRAFATALGLRGSAQLRLSPSPQLAESTPQTIEIMALTRTLAIISGQPELEELRSAVERVLEKEVRYWARLYSQDIDLYRIGLGPCFMARVVYLATLTGPLGLETAQQMVGMTHLGCGLLPGQVIDDHARCYPSADPDSRLAPLSSCLAEEFLGLLVPNPANLAAASVVAADAWAAGVPSKVMEAASRQTLDREPVAGTSAETSADNPEYPAPVARPWLRPMTLRLIRAAASRPHLAQQVLYPLAEKFPQAMTMAGSDVLIELDELISARPRASGGHSRQPGTGPESGHSSRWHDAIRQLKTLQTRDNHHLPAEIEAETSQLLAQLARSLPHYVRNLRE